MVNSSFSEKASVIRLIVTDIDGVWTDAKMYYTSEGDAMKAFSTYDGMAVFLAREAGMEVAIITSENSSIVKSRAIKLKIDDIYLGERNKLSRIHDLCSKYSITPKEVAYIGDDINDLEALRIAGLSALACNSPIVKTFTPDYVTLREGGNGAFRDFVDRIIEARNGMQP